MRKKDDFVAAAMCVGIGIAALLVLVFVIVTSPGHAEALPSPDAASLLAITGDLRLSDAPVDLYVAECLRVDLVSVHEDGAWGDLTLPYVPPGILGVMLFDGWHLIPGVWTQTAETTLRLFFWADDLERLDGTVGIYLVILAEGNDV